MDDQLHDDISVTGHGGIGIPMDAASGGEEEDGVKDKEDSPGGGPAKKKRNRKPVTCAQCRKRKLKCDRGSPCGACRDRNEGHLCEWEGAIRLPQSNYSRDQEAVELRQQLDRLEGLLAVLGTATAGLESPVDRTTGLATLLGAANVAAAGLGVGPSGDGGERSNAAEALGLLAGHSGSGTGSSASGLGSIAPFVGGSGGKTLEQIVSLLPHRAEMDQHLALLPSSLLAILPIHHFPTLEARYKSFNRSLPAKEDGQFLALLFAISGWETFWKTMGPNGGGVTRTGKEGTARTYLGCAAEALFVSHFLDLPTLDGVRTTLILQLYWKYQEQPTTSEFWKGQALKLAFAMGLHRNSYQFAPIESEDRKRLWAIICSTDWLETSGRTYNVFQMMCDALPPSNARDADVTDTVGVLTHPLTFNTPALDLIILGQISNLARQLSDRVFCIHVVPSWATILDMNNEITRSDNSLPASVMIDWVSIDGNAVAKSWSKDAKGEEGQLGRVAIQCEVKALYMRLHRFLLVRGFVDERLSYAREKCIWAARTILLMFQGLGDDPRATRILPLTNHSLNALIILALDLYQEPLGGHYTKANREIVGITIKIFEGILATGRQSKVIKEVLRVVGVLLRRTLAGGGGSGKKRSHDDFLQGNITRSPSFGHATNASSPYHNSGSGSAAHTPGATGHQSMGSILRPFEVSAPFTRPLPIPMSADPSFHSSTLAPKDGSVGNDEQWTHLWKNLLPYKELYAVPDGAEWKEIVEAGRETRSVWSGGIDLLC